MSVTIQYQLKKTDWGWIAIASKEEALVATVLPRKTKTAALTSLKAELKRLGDFTLKESSSTIIKRGLRQLEEYFSGKRQSFDLPLDFGGATAFQQAVWQSTKGIPFGETRSYGRLAKAAGRPQAARAVGMAMAANRFPPIIPCHRVIRGDQSLGGFGGGLALKRKMLDLELNKQR